LLLRALTPDPQASCRPVFGSGIFPDRVRENLKAIRAAAEKARAR